MGPSDLRPREADLTEYAVVTYAHKYKGWWLVVRVEDRAIVKSHPSVKECLAWVEHWGQTELGLSKKGQPLSTECELK